MTNDIEDIEIRLLLEAIYHRYHYDFRGYAQASIRRRLKQAKDFFNCPTYSNLQDRVLHDAAVFTRLVSFLTIQVSELFRDPPYFRAIRESVVPYLKTYPSLKVWIAGCSEGEEVYSMAILFREEGFGNRVIIYATDINPVAIERAEAGVYNLDRMKLFTENHRLAGGKSSLSDYYTAAYGAAVFDKSLREQIVFTDHSLVTDSVFAEVQFVSCRNVLIYFDRELQNRAIRLFHGALSRQGFLGLGMKESLRFTDHADSFIEWNHDVRIYQKKSP